MSSVTEMRPACKLTLENGLTGARYQVEALPPSLAYARGFRLSLLGQWPLGYTCHAHQLPDGRPECDCGLWTDRRECEHTQLLTAAGLLDEPAEARAFNPWEDDELVQIEWDSEAP